MGRVFCGSAPMGKDDLMRDEHNEMQIKSQLVLEAAGCEVQVYGVLDSTNTLGKKLAAAGAAHGTVILADHQTKGRGRLGRSFHSPAQTGLYMSLILKPEDLLIQDPMLLTPFAGVAVCEAIMSLTGKKPQIKWVNDVFLEGLKVCGILAEAVLSDDNQLLALVLGIGVNLFQAEAGLPVEIQGIAGSLFSRDEEGVNRNDLAAAIINYLVNKKGALSNEELRSRYKTHSLILGREVVAVQGTEEFTAIAADIDLLGRLVLIKEDGQQLSLSSGEVRIRPKPLIPEKIPG